MQPKAINPYSFIATKQNEALDFIIANLPLSPTFDQLNEVLQTAMFGVNPPNPDVGPLYLQSVLPLAYNGYVSGKWQVVSGNTEYSEAQMVIINQILEGIQRLPVEAIAGFLSGMEEKIADSALSYQEQLPLYIAIQSGKSAHEYWMAQIATPGGWALYFNADPSINYMHVAGWVSASVQGALLSYGIIKPAQTIIPDIFPALLGAIGLGAGSVVFGWYGN